MNGVMHGDPHVVEVVGREGGIWRGDYRVGCVDRFGIYNGFGPRWNPFYARWWYPHYFYGFYWAINPYYDIDTYYWNPMVYWFYADSWDEGFYNTWYGPNYPIFAQYPGQFYRVGVFYPTISFRDLVVGVSDWEIARQNIFRRRMQYLTEQLELRVSQHVGMTVQLDRNAIVVNHNQVLDDRAVLVDGFVNYGENVQMPFRALLDMTDADQESIFVSESNTDQPSAADAQELDQLNGRVTSMGGVLEDPTQEQAPVVTPAPTTPVVQPQPTAPVSSQFGGEAVIVFNPKNGAWASYHGPYTRAQAEDGALQICGNDCNSVNSAQLEGGGTGIVETWAHNGWVAVATDGQGHWATAGVHDSEADAENAAVTRCNTSAGNSSCYVLRSLASFDYQPDQDGVNPNPSNN